MHRLRDVQTPAKNLGKCPDPTDPERFDETTCNDFPCMTVEPGFTLTSAHVACKAKVDVTFLIDSSGSLGPEGFELSKTFAKDFVKAFEGQDAQLSVIQFWGPVTWGDFYDCSANINANLTDEFMTQRCGLNLVQTLSNDTTKTLSNIDNLQWPGETATTFTSGALLMAREVLRFARQDVEADKRIVVTLTDGIPIDPAATQAAAGTLKSDGTRLVFAAVGLNKRANKYMQRMASLNQMDNFVKIEELQGLGTIGPVNTLIEDVCGLGIQIPE